MHHATDELVSSLLDRAEQSRMCLPATNQAELRRLLRRVGAGGLANPFPYLFVRRTYWETLASKPDIRALHITRGLAELHPDWVFAQASAALAYNLQVTGASLRQVHLAVSRASHSNSLAEIKRHAIPNEELSETQTVGGIRVTSFWRTVFDCLRSLPGREALVIADSVARTCGLDARQIMRELMLRFRKRKGLDCALGIARFADGRSENGGESQVRANIMRLGYEMPELQAWFDNPIDPGSAYRVDFLWRYEDGEPAIVGELDGYRKSEDADLRGGRSAERVLADERRRESRLTAHRVAVMRMSFAEAMDLGYLDKLLRAYGVPRRHESLAWTHVYHEELGDWSATARVHVPKRPLVKVRKPPRQ